MLAALREGWRIVRDSGWILPGLGALVAYHLFVLPSVFVLGPAIAESELERRDELGDHQHRVRHRRGARQRRSRCA